MRRLSGPHEFERGDKPGFSWTRLWQMLFFDPTRLIEFLLAMFFFLVRGSFLLWLGYRHPGIEYFLASVGLSEHRLGFLCIVQAAFQGYASVTERHGLRAWAGVSGLALCVAVNITFNEVEPRWHPVAVVWLTAGLFEVYVIFRNFMARNGGNHGTD